MVKTYFLYCYYFVLLLLTTPILISVSCNFIINGGNLNKLIIDKLIVSALYQICLSNSRLKLSLLFLNMVTLPGLIITLIREYMKFKKIVD